jgi:ribonucleoside-diphosphate reductase alpha chain
MKINRRFTRAGHNVYDQFEYALRSSVLRNPDGSVVFEMHDIEVPKFWSQVATDILAQKYFRKAGVPQFDSEGKPILAEDGTQLLGAERSMKQVAHRLAGCWMSWGREHNYFDSDEDAQAFYDETVYMLMKQMVAPNSPQWFNTGLAWAYGITGPAQGHYFVDPVTLKLTQSKDAYSHPAPHACFIQSVNDDLVNEGGIFDLVTREARIFKYGAGTGSNFSAIRAENEPLSGGGVSSGLMSFLKINDRAAGAVKSGGTTRRAAKMVILNADHPDIEKFIDWKMVEEQKVASLVAGSKICNLFLNQIMQVASKEGTDYKTSGTPLHDLVQHALNRGVPMNYIVRVLELVKQGYTGIEFDEYDTHYEGEAYITVSGQNSNNTIRVSEEFMEAVERDDDWQLTRRTDGVVTKTLKARELWEKINFAAWSCADPGLQFDTTINEWHTCLKDGRINASNPCCITGDTLIAVADGRNAVPIRDLVGQEVPVYAWDHASGRTTISRMWNIEVKRHEVPVYRVRLDDGSSFRATDDHLIMLRDGSYRQVKDLRPGDSLNPFHSNLMQRGKSRTTRRYVYSGRGWRPQYRWIWENANGAQPEGYHIHHRDCNSLNDSLDNLELLEADEHRALHRDQMLGENNPARRMMSNEWRAHIAEAVRGEKNPHYGKAHTPETREKLRAASARRWSDPEQHERLSAAAKQWMAEAREKGIHLGRPAGERYDRCCPACRKNFMTHRQSQIFCSRECRYSPIALEMIGEKGGESRRGHSPSPEHREKLRQASIAASRPEDKRRAAAESVRSQCLKAARLLLDNGEKFSLENWDQMREAARSLGAHRVPGQEVVARFFPSNADLYEYAKLYNHKVVSVELDGVEDVYDGTVDTHHNFAIVTSQTPSKSSSKGSDYSGCFIHNSEYLFLDDTACNLASINLSHFYDHERRTFDVEGYKHAARIWTVVLEVSVLMAQFPSKTIAQKSFDYRTLGLGYANIGTVLMTAGIPYDSDLGRAWAGALTAIMTGEAYATSAELARDLGPFPRYKPNAKQMLRVIRNHRRAAHNAPVSEYENLSIKPVGIDHALCPENMSAAAKECWDRALALGEQHGYRNAQVTVIAPTGTISLVMDCDTTGIEPDFAIVKFKKLAGGGYFKIVNQSVTKALRVLGYSDTEIVEIERYIKGHGTLRGCPHINRAELKERGFTDEKIEVIERQLDTVFDIRFAFNKWALGEDFLRTLGFSASQLDDPSFDLLRALGFNAQQIEETNNYVCGMMTIEGAPGLKAEHLPVFDCANRCGKYGQRYIDYMGHVKMLAAAQPFLSGASSKTINMPHDATVEEVAHVYHEAWRLMVKAIALYRDGSKLSQPLNVTSDTDLVDEVTVSDAIGSEENFNETIGAAQIHERIVEKVYHRAERRRLPKRRHGFVREATVGGHKVFLRTGEYEDGTLGEIFIDMYKEGASFKGLMNCFAVLASKALQYGMPLEKMVDTFTFTRFEPAGPVFGHEAIKSATSIIDYVFRAIGYEYLGREDFVHVKAVDESGGTETANGTGREEGSGHGKRKLSPGQELYARQTAAAIDSTGAAPIKAIGENMKKVQTARAQGYTGEQCGNCGSMRVKQNGACHVCEDCGTTSGCS